MQNHFNATLGCKSEHESITAYEIWYSQMLVWPHYTYHISIRHLTVRSPIHSLHGKGIWNAKGLILFPCKFPIAFQCQWEQK